MTALQMDPAPSNVMARRCASTTFCLCFVNPLTRLLEEGAGLTVSPFSLRRATTIVQQIFLVKNTCVECMVCGHRECGQTTYSCEAMKKENQPIPMRRRRNRYLPPTGRGPFSVV
eukprot:symbB.v1.2.000438.t1/scaffold32.1/size405148/11